MWNENFDSNLILSIERFCVKSPFAVSRRLAAPEAEPKTVVKEKQ